jgi:hypothetical protein
MLFDVVLVQLLLTKKFDDLSDESPEAKLPLLKFGNRKNVEICLGCGPTFGLGGKILSRDNP